MTINFNSPVDENGDVKITIHSIGDEKSIYSDRDTGVEKSVTDLLARHKALSDKANEIMDKQAINYDSVLSVEEISPGILLRNMPRGGWDYEPSKTNLAISIEAIHFGKVALLGGAVALICGIIYKVVKKVIDFLTGNGNTIEAATERAGDNAKKVQAQIETTTPKEVRVANSIQQSSNKLAILEWLKKDKQSYNAYVRAITFYEKSTGIKLDTDKIYDSVKSLVGLKGENSTNGNGSILANTLPAIMFSKNIDNELINYFEYYGYIKQNIRKISIQMQDLRTRMMAALGGDKTPPPPYDYSSYLEPLNKLLGKRYNDPSPAIKDLKTKIDDDWVNKYKGKINKTHMANITRIVSETPHIKNLVSISGDKILETEISAMMGTINYELANSDSPHKKAIQNLINSNVGTEDEKSQRIKVSEKYLEVIKDNLNIIKVIAETNTLFLGNFISVVKNIDVTFHNYNAFYMHYNEFLDAYEKNIKE